MDILMEGATSNIAPKKAPKKLYNMIEALAERARNGESINSKDIISYLDENDTNPKLVEWVCYALLFMSIDINLDLPKLFQKLQQFQGNCDVENQILNVLTKHLWDVLRNNKNLITDEYAKILRGVCNKKGLENVCTIKDTLCASAKQLLNRAGFPFEGARITGGYTKRRKRIQRRFRRTTLKRI